MDRQTYLVVSCPWCASTVAAHRVDESVPVNLGWAIIEAAKSGRVASLRRPASPDGFPTQACRCEPGGGKA